MNFKRVFESFSERKVIGRRYKTPTRIDDFRVLEVEVELRARALQITPFKCGEHFMGWINNERFKTLLTRFQHGNGSTRTRFISLRDEFEALLTGKLIIVTHPFSLAFPKSRKTFPFSLEVELVSGNETKENNFSALEKFSPSISMFLRN